MKYIYRVYHSEECKSKMDALLNPLSQEMQLREYQFFPTALHLHFTGTSIAASCVSADPETDGMLVTFISDMPMHEAESALAKFIVKLNNAIRGLCFVINRPKN